ncbi:MAG: hypothetical protein JF628_06950 [Sphingomonas sp.]|nr:hypothetical protein [Sphingomonas sp.]
MLSMLIFAAATAAQPVVAQPNAEALKPVCRMKGIEVVAPDPKKPVRAQKLNELPNADAFHTVLRTDEHGCNKPAIIAYDIGSAPKRQR